MEWLHLGLLGTFLDNNLKRFPFWKKNIYRFIVFSISFLLFFTLLFSIISKYPLINLFKLVCIFSPIYGLWATLLTNKNFKVK